MVPKGLLTFLGFLGNAEFSSWKRLPDFIKLRKSLKICIYLYKKFVVVFVAASDAMDFLFFLFGGGGGRVGTNCVMFLR